MTHREKNPPDFLERHLGLFKSPPLHSMHQAEQRILQRLRSESAGTAEDFQAGADPVRPGWMPALLATAAVAAAVVLGFLVRTPAVRNLNREKNVQVGDTVRTDAGLGTVLVLA